MTEGEAYAVLVFAAREGAKALAKEAAPGRGAPDIVQKVDQAIERLGLGAINKHKKEQAIDSAGEKVIRFRERKN